jgi:plasmid stabilization system protein ParE
MITHGSPDMIDIGRARAFLDERERIRQAATDALFEKAQGDCKRIVASIAGRFRPVRIYQWGSLLDRSHFTERSDIDLAVEGLGSAKEYSALLAACERMTDFPLDIVQIERIEPEYAELVRDSGKVVYERDREDTEPPRTARGR